MGQVLKEMPTNSRKRAMTRRMYMSRRFKKAMGKAKASICNEMEARMVVMTASQKRKLRNFWVLF